MWRVNVKIRRMAFQVIEKEPFSLILDADDAFFDSDLTHGLNRARLFPV